MSKKKCKHHNNWFDRTLCAEPCGSMHTWCNDCGECLGYCPHLDPRRPKPIYLPPEPPRDRIVEATNTSGEFMRMWQYDEGSWLDPGRLERSEWADVVWAAITDRCSLSHKPQDETS